MSQRSLFKLKNSVCSSFFDLKNSSKIFGPNCIYIHNILPDQNCFYILIRCDLFYTLKNLSLTVLLRIILSVVSTY